LGSERSQGAEDPQTRHPERSEEGAESKDPLATDALERYRQERRARSAKTAARKNGLPGDFRAATEDDDGYDPYSDYMDALARSGYEPPEADPWR